MQKRILFTFLFVSVVLLTFLPGCDNPPPGLENSLLDNREPEDRPLSGKLHVNNKTGHSIFINDVYIANGGSKEFSDSSNHADGLEYSVDAFGEEFDAAGNVVWGYKYNSNFNSWAEEAALDLTPATNQYRLSENSYYPIMPGKKLTITNKTGYKVSISENNQPTNIILTLDDTALGEVTINQLITDNKSFYFYVVQDSGYGLPLRMTLGRSFLRTHTAVDAPPELISQGVVNY